MEKEPVTGDDVRAIFDNPKPNKEVRVFGKQVKPSDWTYTSDKDFEGSWCVAYFDCNVSDGWYDYEDGITPGGASRVVIFKEISRN